MKVKLIAKIDENKVNKILEQGVEYFKKLELESLKDVDLEKCIDDYVGAVFLYHDFFTVVTVDSN